MTGSHEVRGSIPLGSTNPIARRRVAILPNLERPLPIGGLSVFELTFLSCCNKRGLRQPISSKESSDEISRPRTLSLFPEVTSVSRRPETVEF